MYTQYVNLVSRCVPVLECILTKLNLVRSRNSERVRSCFEAVLEYELACRTKLVSAMVLYLVLDSRVPFSGRGVCDTLGRIYYY